MHTLKVQVFRILATHHVIDAIEAEAIHVELEGGVVLRHADFYAVLLHRLEVFFLRRFALDDVLGVRRLKQPKNAAVDLAAQMPACGAHSVLLAPDFAAGEPEQVEQALFLDLAAFKNPPLPPSDHFRH
ncbi:hypothetical protein GOB33_22320 [Sinorhizobium meliloti]|nr:hypothetical protein [Sinorhizobium meliloti]